MRYSQEPHNASFIGLCKGVAACCVCFCPSSQSLYCVCLLGGAAGAGAGLTQYRGVAHAATQIARCEGVGALYRGVGVVVVSAAPAQGLFFLGNDVGREVLTSACPRLPAPVAHFLAGFFAQLCGSLAWVPMDTIKERLQIEGQLLRQGKGELLGSSLGAVRTIWRLEGARGFYPAYWMHQFTWAPFNGLYFALYEQSRELAIAHGAPQWPCGLLAGVVAGVVTNPIDLVKTRLQVARTDPTTFQYKGALDCCAQLVRREGAIALFDGVFARVLLLTPRLTIAVTAKEALMPYFK